MKYFDEEQMAETRKRFEDEVLKWKGVHSKAMMGCLCYFSVRKFIAFLVTKGIVVMKLSKEDQALMKKMGGRPFEMGGKTGKLWLTPLNGPRDVRSVLPFVKKSYEVASSL